MKKVVLIAVFLIFSSLSFAQTSRQINQCKYYVEQCALEYGIDEAGQEALFKTRIKYMADYFAIMKNEEDKKITEEVRKIQIQELNRQYNMYMIRLFKVERYMDISMFIEAMQGRMKDVN